MSSFKWNRLPKQQLREIARRFSSQYIPMLEKAIKDDIKKGVSPVYKKRMVKYSKSYKKQITRGKKSFANKSKSLVNLYLTGKMMKSLVITATKKGFHIVFKDKKSSYHNEGTKNIPRRAMLPRTKDERFNNRITKISKLLLARISRDVINKK